MDQSFYSITSSLPQGLLTNGVGHQKRMGSSLLNLFYNTISSSSNRFDKLLHSTSWSGRSLKKVKFSIWELSHNSINTCDKYQRRAPQICLSPDCCTICKRSSESAAHLFGHCPFITACWNFTFATFGWNSPIPGDIGSLVTMLQIDHMGLFCQSFLMEIMA